jgi:hypothetical protein
MVISLKKAKPGVHSGEGVGWGATISVPFSGLVAVGIMSGILSRVGGMYIVGVTCPEQATSRKEIVNISRL